MLTQTKLLAPILALGTDAAHRFPHVPDGVVEMQYLVALGFTPMQVIVAATKNAAAAICCGETLGQLQVGRMADVLMVEGNPAEDISTLRNKRNILRMWKGGVEVALAQDRGPVGIEFDPSLWLWRDFDQLSAA